MRVSKIIGGIVLVLLLGFSIWWIGCSKSKPKETNAPAVATVPTCATNCVSPEQLAEFKAELDEIKAARASAPPEPHGTAHIMRRYKPSAAHRSKVVAIQTAAALQNPAPATPPIVAPPPPPNDDIAKLTQIVKDLAESFKNQTTQPPPQIVVPPPAPIIIEKEKTLEIALTGKPENFCKKDGLDLEHFTACSIWRQAVADERTAAANEKMARSMKHQTGWIAGNTVGTWLIAGTNLYCTVSGCFNMTQAQSQSQAQLNMSSGAGASAAVRMANGSTLRVIPSLAKRVPQFAGAQ